MNEISGRDKVKSFQDELRELMFVRLAFDLRSLAVRTDVEKEEIKEILDEFYGLFESLIFDSVGRNFYEDGFVNGACSLKQNLLKGDSLEDTKVEDFQVGAYVSLKAYLKGK